MNELVVVDWDQTGLIANGKTWNYLKKVILLKRKIKEDISYLPHSPENTLKQ